MTEHSFNTKIAKEYGIECAIVIKNLDFWLSKNRANNKNYHDGKYWTYMSMTGFSEYFEYLTGNQVRYILKKLEENGVIETGNYNKKGYDRTKWYAFTDSFVKSYNSILQYSHIHLVKFPDAFEKIPEPIPYTNTDTKTDTDIIYKEFEMWWSEYPKHTGKKKCKEKYAQLYKKKVLPDLNTHIKILKNWKKTKKWIDGFSNNPLTWLNGELWEDELPKQLDMDNSEIIPFDNLFAGNEESI